MVIKRFDSYKDGARRRSGHCQVCMSWHDRKSICLDWVGTQREIFQGNFYNIKTHGLSKGKT